MNKRYGQAFVFRRWLMGELLHGSIRDQALEEFEHRYRTIQREKNYLMAFLWYGFQILALVPNSVKGSIVNGSVMLISYLKIALRNILKHKIFSLINIFGLAVSLSLCLLVIKTITVMYSIDRFHENKDRIYRVTSHVVEANQVQAFATAPLPLADELAQHPGVERTVRVKNRFRGGVSRGDRVLRIGGYFVDQAFLDVFSFPLESGDVSTALAEPYSIVLTKEWVAKFFGHQDPVGKSISVSELGEYTITGVLQERRDRKSHFRFECLVSASTLTSLEAQGTITPCLDNWMDLSTHYVYLLIREGVSPASVEAAFPRIVQTHYKDKVERRAFRMQPLTKISPGPILSHPLTMPVPPMVAYLFSSIALVITVVACFNYTNLSLAKSLSRAKEVGIRKVVGANRLKLFTQFIGEAVTMSLIALFFAYLLLRLIEPLFYDIIPDFRIHFYVEQQPVVLPLVFFLFSVLLGVAAGFLPALYLAKFNPTVVLKDISKVRVFSRITLRKTLIVIQFFISLLFVIMTMVMYRQLRFQKSFDPGFRVRNIVNVPLQGVSYETFKNEIVNYHLVEEVSACSFLPNTGVSWGTEVRKSNSGEQERISFLSIDADFITNLGLELVAGQGFSEETLTGNEKFVILNEKAVQRFGFSSPVDAIGQTLLFEESRMPLEVIGVVKDFIHLHSQNSISPLALRMIPKYFRYANVRLRPQDTEKTLLLIQDQWESLETHHPFTYRFYEDAIADYYAGPDNMMRGIGFVAFLAIMIAFFGLLGMVIYEMEARVKEVGIRKVLGATLMDVISSVSKGFVSLLLIAALVAIPVAWFLSRLFLQNFAYRISLGIGLFAFAILAVCGLGLVIIFSQTLRAAVANPVDALRSE